MTKRLRNDTLEQACRIVGRRGRGQDRCTVVPTRAGLVAVVADGAGGSAGGAEAAEAVVKRVRAILPDGTAACERLLWRLDAELLDDPIAGESTAIIAVVSGDIVQGASVGDSAALLFGPGEADVHDLTAAQQRKPLLGSGRSMPVSFRGTLGLRTLVLATDGLHAYWTPSKARRALAERDLTRCTRHLVDSVRLPSGDLCDDVGLVLVRRASCR